MLVYQFWVSYETPRRDAWPPVDRERAAVITADNYFVLLDIDDDYADEFMQMSEDYENIVTTRVVGSGWYIGKDKDVFVDDAGNIYENLASLGEVFGDLFTESVEIDDPDELLQHYTFYHVGDKLGKEPYRMLGYSVWLNHLDAETQMLPARYRPCVNSGSDYKPHTKTPCNWGVIDILDGHRGWMPEFVVIKER